MAILFSQADGSDQHYDTYEEFEQAMILMKRLNGEEVPQDLLDEAKAKHGDKEPKPFQVQIDGNNFESAISEATRELAEALDEVADTRTPVSDEIEIPEKESKFDLGDKIRVVENNTSGHVVGTIGEIVGMEYLERENRWSYEVHPTSKYMFEHSLRHRESDLELYDDEIEVEVGDKVRVVSSEDGTGTPYHYHDVGSVGKVASLQQYGRIEVEVGGETQFLLPHHYEKLEVQVDGEEPEFKVGDKVRVVGNAHGHLMKHGEVREIKSVDSDEPKYNLSEVNNGFWAGTSDIEHEHNSTGFRTGDIVRVTEEFEDHFGDRAKRGSVYEYDENFGFAEPFVGTVFLGDNLDKLELVCRAQDRLDK